MEPRDLSPYRDRIEADLRGNVLPFWMEHVADFERGTFRATIANNGTRSDAPPRGCLLTTRILWTFAAAWRVYGDADYLRMADLAYHDLESRFRDDTHGGYVWSIHPDGSWERDRKQVYGQAFAIYALSELHWCSGDPAPLEQAKALFRLLEHYARDPQHGGYGEAFARDWRPIEDVRLSAVDQNDPKSQNTLLHVMEAYTNLLRVWPDAGLRVALEQLVHVMLDHVIQPETRHLGLFFTSDWTPTSDRISYGHDIEASWLLWEAAGALNDEALKAKLMPVVLDIADVTLAEGCDDDGAIFNLGGPAGVVDTHKEWWPQAEGMVGFLNAAQISGDPRYLDAALRLWDFIEARLIDRDRGEWFRGVDRAGNVLSEFDKVSFWKCPYHNGRAGLESLSRLNVLAAFAPSGSAPSASVSS